MGHETGEASEEAMCCFQDNRFGAKKQRGQIYVVDSFLCSLSRGGGCLDGQDWKQGDESGCPDET